MYIIASTTTSTTNATSGNRTDSHQLSIHRGGPTETPGGPEPEIDETIPAANFKTNKHSLLLFTRSSSTKKRQA